MSIQTETCPLCDEGSLRDASYDRAVEHNGMVSIVHTKASECDVCGCVQASQSQVRDNQRSMAAFQKLAENRLTGQEMRDARKLLGITQSQAAIVFGGGSNSFTKYESDDVTQSEAMDKLVRLAVEVPEARAWLYAKADIIKESEHFYPFLKQSIRRDKFSFLNIQPEPYNSYMSPLNTTGAYGKIVRQSLTGLWHHLDLTVEVESMIEGLHVGANEVDSNVRMYDADENAQYFLSPQYSEEDYDRHSQK